MRVVARELAQHCSYAVFRWEEAPKLLQELCSQGGDEDWLVVTETPDPAHLIPPWVDRLDATPDPAHLIPPWVDRLDAGFDPLYFELLDTLILVGAH